MKEKITRKEQAKNTKKKLLDTAITLFKKYGYEKVTIEQICKEADVTTGAFYHHLKSKAGVIIEGYAEFDEFIIQNSNLITISDKSGKEKIVNIIELLVEYVNQLGVKAITEVYKTQISEESSFFLKQERAMLKMIYEIIDIGQKTNEFTTTSRADVIANEIVIIARGIIYNWCQCDGEYDLLPFAERIVGNYISVYEVK